MSDRGPEGQDGAEPTEPPSEADLAIILGGDPDAVTTTSHDIIKAGFDDSLPDDADDVALVPSEPIASPRVGREEHVVPRAKRRWWFSRHHHRETDHGRAGADRSDQAEPGEYAPSKAAPATSPTPAPGADPLSWLPPKKSAAPPSSNSAEPSSKTAESPSEPAPETPSEPAARTNATPPAADSEAAADVAPNTAPDAAPAEPPVYETRKSRRAKDRG